jgi:hypothetical protein
MKKIRLLALFIILMGVVVNAYSGGRSIARCGAIPVTIRHSASMVKTLGVAIFAGRQNNVTFMGSTTFTEHVVDCTVITASAEAVMTVSVTRLNHAW